MEKEEQISVHEEMKEEEGKAGTAEMDQKNQEQIEEEARVNATTKKEEQLKVEEEWEEDVEDAVLLVRRSKPGNNTAAVNVSANPHATHDEVSSNGKVEHNDSNGSVYESMVSVTINAGADESAVVEEGKPKGVVEPTSTTFANGDSDKTHEANENGQQRSEDCVYYDKKEGCNFISFLPGEEPNGKNPALEGLNVTSLSTSVEKSPTSANNYQYQKRFKDESLPTSTLWPSEFLHNDHNASYKSSSTKEIESAEVDLIDETDVDVAGIDVEKVLQKQNTHDLFCPNCNSCITRRVILRKRKRRIRTPTEDIKRNKPQPRVEDQVAAISLQGISDQDRDTNIHDVSSSIPAANDYDHEGEPDIFRCLSCFSFFIPTGNGFKLFGTFGRKGEKPTTQDGQILETNKNWFSYIFPSNKGKRPAEQGSANRTDLVEDEREAFMPSLIVSSENGQSSLTKGIISTVPISEGLVTGGMVKPRGPALNGNATINLGDKSHDTVQFDQGGAVLDTLGIDNGKQLKQSSSSKQYLPSQGTDEAVPGAAGRAPVTNGEYAMDAVSAPRQDGLKLLISSDIGNPLLDKSQANQILDMDIQKTTRDDEAVSNISVSNGKIHISVDIPQQYEQDAKALIVPDRVLEDKNSTFKVSHKDEIYGNQNSSNTITKAEVKFHTGEALKANREVAAKIASGTDTVILMEAGPIVAEAPQGVEPATVSSEAGASLVGAQASPVEPSRTEDGENYRIEIIKSIVYGGLVESIASLSVVSSAAGGGAATLNTVALGLANLIGGIFVIVHNLWQLKNEQEDQAINQVTERADRYQELLGRRKNFMLHAVVTMLSYIIFGLLPPIIYGFSFRKSDDREFKLLVVAAASFLSIIILATAKAYVQRPPKSYLNTIIRYIVLGFMVSGVSYIAGEWFNRLLEQLGLFDQSSAPTLSPPDMISNNQAWASF